MKIFGLISMVITMAIIGYLMQKRVTTSPSSAMSSEQEVLIEEISGQTGKVDQSTLTKLPGQIETNLKAKHKARLLQMKGD